MQTMHLFAGAGGGLLADLILGHNPIIAVEWEPYCCQVLRERTDWFPDLQVYEGDIRLFDPSEYKGRVDCIHAGFPCQDISLAGNNAGLGEGTRSGLYREILRIAGVVRPGLIFLENVSAIRSRGMGTVLKDLAALGYDAQWCCLRASDVGAPHKRDRWWCLCHTKHDGQSTAEIGESSASGNDHFEAGTKQTGKLEGSGKQHAELAFTESIGIQRHRPSGQQELQAHAGQVLSMRNSERPRATTWDVEPGVGRVVNGLASRVDRIKALGNGQVPLQAAVAFSLLYKKVKNDRRNRNPF
jgi:DNA (cytosine-5)-methyltransferase 1